MEKNGFIQQGCSPLFLGRKSESLDSRFPAWPAPGGVHLLLAVSVDLI